jgi:Holliday junction resolvase RusA-like endonuclease
MKPLSGPVSVKIVAHRPAKRGDLDNMLKVALDALKGIAWEDDEQIEVLTAARFEDKENPRLEIRVEHVPIIQEALK